MMNFEYILYAVSNRVATITLNRPEKRNALNFEIVAELKAALKEAAEDSEVKVVIIKANGEAFCAGADLGYLQKLQSYSYEQNLDDSSHLKELFYLIYTSPKIIIAQIQGHALAGGCGLATVCDFSFSVPEAKFGYTEVKIGFIPAIVMVFLLRKIGEGKARQLLLTGELITAEDAKSLGLINFISPSENLEHDVKAFANKLITGNSLQAMQTTKQMIADIQSKSLNEALTFAAEQNAKARASDDCKRGISSFLNKEKLLW
jgi:methylglutaconyl-CoA hydratase